MFTLLSDSSFINRSGCGRNSNGLRWRWLVFWFWLCHPSGTRPWVVGFGSPCLSFFIGKMRSLNKIKSESPSTYKLCISSQKAAHTVLVSFHRHLVSGSVPGTGGTEINDTQSLSKRTDSWVENTVLQTDGYAGRRGAEGSTEEGLDCPRAGEFGEGDLEEVRVKSALWRNCPCENKKEEGTGQRWVSCAHLSLLHLLNLFSWDSPLPRNNFPLAYFSTPLSHHAPSRLAEICFCLLHQHLLCLLLSFLCPHPFNSSSFFRDQLKSLPQKSLSWRSRLVQVSPLYIFLVPCVSASWHCSIVNCVLSGLMFV